MGPVIDVAACRYQSPVAADGRAKRSVTNPFGRRTHCMIAASSTRAHGWQVHPWSRVTSRLPERRVAGSSDGGDPGDCQFRAAWGA